MFMNITNDIRTVLNESGWKQERLAKEANIHPVSLSNLLNEKRKKSVIDALLPFIYGEKRPSAFPNTSATEEVNSNASQA